MTRTYGALAMIACATGLPPAHAAEPPLIQIDRARWEASAADVASLEAGHLLPPRRGAGVTAGPLSICPGAWYEIRVPLAVDATERGTRETLAVVAFSFSRAGQPLLPAAGVEGLRFGAGGRWYRYLDTRAWLADPRDSAWPWKVRLAFRAPDDADAARVQLVSWDNTAPLRVGRPSAAPVHGGGCAAETGLHPPAGAGPLRPPCTTAGDPASPDGCNWSLGSIETIRLSGAARALRIPVAPATTYALNVDVGAASAEGEHPALVQVLYRDATGAPIPGPYPGLVTSDTVGPYAYLDPDARPLGRAEARLETPPHAAVAELGFRSWHDTYGVALAPHGTLRRIPPGACGDGRLDAKEACDDGNTRDGDGCRADCGGLEACGDGHLDPGEECEPETERASCPACLRIDPCGADGFESPALAWRLIDSFLPPGPLREGARSAAGHAGPSAALAILAAALRDREYSPGAGLNRLRPRDDFDFREHLAQGQLLLPPFPPIPLPERPTWDEDPFVSATWTQRYQSLFWVEALAPPFPAPIPERVASYLDSWIRGNSLPCGAGTSAWDDHAAAWRTEVLLRLLLRTADPADARDAERFGSRLASLLQHAVVLDAWLESPAFHAHNHSLLHTTALFQVARALPELSRSPEWLRRSLDRIARLTEELIGPDGFTAEQSADYHRVAMWQLRLARKLVASVPQGKELAGRIEARLHLAITAAERLTLPDGSLVRLGDTGDFPGAAADLRHWLRESFPDEAAEWRAGEALDETENDPTFQEFPASGHAVFRTRGEGPGGGRHLLLDYSPQVHSHGHHDATSFTWFDGGQPWVVDSGGPYLYGPSEPRAYVLSSRAHNLCQVRGRDQLDGDSNLRSARFGALGGEALVETWADGAGVRHLRRVHLGDSGVLTVTDWIDMAAEEIEIECFVHLERGTDVSLDRSTNSATLRRGGVARHVAVAGPRATLEVVAGETQPWQGWIATGDDEIVPATVLVVRLRGVAPVATLILGPDAAEVERLRLDAATAPPRDPSVRAGN